MKRVFGLLALLGPFLAAAQLQSPAPEAGETFVQNVVDGFAPIENDTVGPGQSYDLTYLFNPDWGVNSSIGSFVSVAATPNGKVFGGAEVAIESDGVYAYYSYGNSYEYPGGVQNNLIVA